MLPAMAPLAELMQSGQQPAGCCRAHRCSAYCTAWSPDTARLFIIAVRRSVVQAVLLGFAATVSRTFVVWVVALIGMHSGSRYYGAVAEPYFQMATITHTRPPMS